MPRGGIDELRGDAHAVAGASDGTFEHIGGAKLLARLQRCDRFIAECKHLRAGEYLQLFDLQKLCDNVLGNSIAEIFVLFRATLVFEVKHSD